MSARQANRKEKTLECLDYSSRGQIRLLEVDGQVLLDVLAISTHQSHVELDTATKRRHTFRDRRERALCQARTGLSRLDRAQ
jgi:hypothetical protein